MQGKLSGRCKTHDIWTAYKILVEKPEADGMEDNGEKNNIKIYVKETWSNDVDWNQLAQYRG